MRMARATVSSAARSQGRRIAGVGPDGGFSIRIVASRTGIAAETLRIWERRYGFPKPQRRPGGGRVYAESDIARLRLIARGREAGYRPGDLVPLSEAELSSLVEADERNVGGASDRQKPGGSTTLPDLGDLMTAVARDDVATLRRALRALAAFLGPRRFVTEVADPLSAKLGESWACGAIGVRHEHLASHVLSTQLRVCLALLEEAEDAAPAGLRRRPAIVLATLPGEAHVLGLEMVAVYLAARGSMPRILGADTPVEEIAAAAEAMAVPYVGISVATVRDVAPTRRLVEELGSALARLAKPPELWLGGAGAESVLTTRVAARLVTSWQAVDAALRGREG